MEGLVAHLAAGIGAALAIIGAGYGIGRLAESALEGMARQPEAAGDIRTAMIIAAALIEGLAFLALVICLLLSFK
jgi:F-type H+-transporting ATPase subunit c